jgi:RNA polymerase sigma-70 factor (ECF subfamily)
MAESEDEHHWIRSSLSGDEHAYAALVAQHQRMIQALTYRMTGSFSNADDLAQETFIRAFQQLGSFRGESKFSTWLCRIAMNLCLNWRQREGRRESVHRVWAHDALPDDGSVAPATPDEASGRVQDVLNRLPAKQRAAIVLTIYEGMNHATAARVLGCSETTVSWRVFSAKAKLKRWLSQEGSHE